MLQDWTNRQTGDYIVWLTPKQVGEIAKKLPGYWGNMVKRKIIIGQTKIVLDNQLLHMIHDLCGLTRMEYAGDLKIKTTKQKFPVTRFINGKYKKGIKKIYTTKIIQASKKAQQLLAQYKVKKECCWED